MNLLGDRLLRAINEAVREWEISHKGLVVLSEGALVTIVQRPELNHGYEIKIQYPFIVQEGDLEK